MAGVVVTLASAVGLIKCTDHLSKVFHIDREAEKVLVTGVAGDIGYAILPMIARGLMLGVNQPVILHMLDTDDRALALKNVEMELIDAAFPLLQGVVATTKAKEACKGVNVAVMIGVESVSTVKAELGKHADENCKVLVVANRADTKALKLEEETRIRKENITYLTRLEHNRALGQIAKKLGILVSGVRNVFIEGKEAQDLNVDHAIVTTKNNEEKSVKTYVGDKNRFATLKNELKTTVLQHRAASSSAMKQSSALSTASSACDHVRDWLLGTPKGTCVSMGVYSDGSYGSFPVTCDGEGNWRAVKKFDKTTMKPIVDKN